MPYRKPKGNTPEERAAREAAHRNFELSMRQAVMEYDSLDGNGDKILDFREFSQLIREREMGVHTEEVLLERFNEIDADGSGSIDVTEFIGAALKDAFSRSAADLDDIFSAWDADGSGEIDPSEFREVVRHFGFQANDQLIDDVFSTLDYSKTGTLDLRDLKVRLELEAARRNRPMQKLRRIQDREEGRDAVVSLAGQKFEKIDLTWSIAEQAAARRARIMNALKAQSARVMDLFRAWDTNGDGLMSKAEFHEAVKQLGIDDSTWVNRKGVFDEGLRVEDIDAVFHSMKSKGKKEGKGGTKDGASSDTIAYHDLRKALEAPRAKLVVLKQENLVKREQESLSAELKSDSVIKNIKLSAEGDIIAQLTAGLAANWAKITELFARWDIDTNGTVNRAELRNAMNELGLRAHPKATDAFFTLMDVDKSGDISLEEFSNVIKASMREANNRHMRSVLGTAPRGATTLPPLGDFTSAATNGGIGTPRSPRNIVGPPPRQRTILKPPPVQPIVIPEPEPVPKATLKMPSPTPPPAQNMPFTRPLSVRAPRLQIPGLARAR